MSPAGDLTPDTSSGTKRRWIHWIGALLALSAIVLLALQFRENASEISVRQLEGAWKRVLAAAACYSLCGILLGLIWWLCVRCANANTPPVLACIQVNMASQLGKYLPGNVAHFAARHWMMRKRGAAHIQLIAAGLLEALVLVIAAAVLAVAVIQPAAERLLGWDIPFAIQLSSVSVALVAGLAGWILARRRAWIDDSTPALRTAFLMLAAVLFGVLFFIGMSACFILVSDTFVLSDITNVLPWIAASWMLGFIVPGAPGGIGVREYVLVLGLSPLIGEAPALLDAALFRLVTIAGDALMAMAGLIAMRQAPAKAPTPTR